MKKNEMEKEGQSIAERCVRGVAAEETFSYTLELQQNRPSSSIPGSHQEHGWTMETADAGHLSRGHTQDHS